MSDVSQPSAPPPSSSPPVSAPPTAAPPAQADVPVSAPVDSPRPLGDQAPQKPEGQESNKSSHISRREALENAFKRAHETQEEAKKNLPPKSDRPAKKEASTKEAPAKDAAKQPEKPAEKPQRYREAGKFARDPAKTDAGQQAEPAQQPAQQIKPLDERAPYRLAPNRFSDQAKQEWNAAPESVRGAVYQMAKEFNGAYQKYRADNQVMDELRPYHQLAVKQGTTLRKAFDNYYNMEAKLRQDLVGGLDVIVQNVARSQGLVGPHGGPLTLRDVVNHVGSMTPEQQQLSQQRNQQTASEMQLGQMRQKIAQQEQTLNQILYHHKFTSSRQQVDAFADAHPRFDELADIIKAELDLGFSLDVAYQRANRLRPPDPQAAQTRTQSAQTRKTSISGAPDGQGRAGTRPSDGQRRKNGEAKHPTRREALEKAFRRAGNGV